MQTQDKHFFNEELNRSHLTNAFNSRVGSSPPLYAAGTLRVGFLGHKCVFEGLVKGARGVWDEDDETRALRYFFDFFFFLFISPFYFFGGVDIRWLFLVLLTRSSFCNPILRLSIPRLPIFSEAPARTRTIGIDRRRRVVPFSTRVWTAMAQELDQDV